MKTRLLLLCAVFVACIQQTNATIWRVNNNGYSANFKELQEANDDPNNVVDGDTIHLQGSATIYKGATITKRLIIIGSGYFLPYNLNTSANKLTTNISDIAFKGGSAGSQLLGINVSGVFGISIVASNITIKRCKVDNSITLSDNISDIKILQNYFSNNNASTINTSPFGFPTDIIFNNNICQRTLIISPINYIFQECNNNIFDVPTATPAIQIYAGSFQNNILTNPNATAIINGGDFTNVSYNISASRNNQFGTGNNNIVVTDTSTLFVGGTSPDGRYQLKAGSPAIGNGSDGTNRGVFGGGAPQNWYTLSGLAAIPVVYDISSTGVGSTELPVIIKARTIK